jgi:hypothetical protein
MLSPGKGAKQFFKGLGLGTVRFLTMPINAPLRATFNLAVGVKNQVSGKSDYGQRYRYPRYIDSSEFMPCYDPLMAYAQTALRSLKKNSNQ